MFPLTLKEVAAKKLRLVTTAIAVMLGVAFMAGTLIFSSTIGHTFNGLLSDAFAGTDAYVRGESSIDAGFGAPLPRLDASLVETIKSVPGVAAAEGLIQGYAQLVDAEGKPVGDPGSGAPTNGLAWLNTPGLNPYRLVEGSPPTANGQIVIDKHSADTAHMHVGDTATVMTKVGPSSFTITGIAMFGDADSAGGSSAVLFTPDDAQTFVKKLNEPILPTFLSVVFDPTLERDGETDLLGHYAFDDEGVKARRVVAVDKGVLKTFLMSRAPVAGILHSNGHGRAMPGLPPVSRQSNLVVEASEAVPFDELVARLKREIRQQGRPFGLFFQNIEGGFTFTGRVVPNAFNVLPNVVYRVYPDDRPMELVRGVDLIGTPLTTFGRILAASREHETFNGICGAESGSVPVSASSPALLIGQIEVQKKLKSQEGLPVLPAPGRAKS